MTKREADFLVGLRETTFTVAIFSILWIIVVSVSEHNITLHIIPPPPNKQEEAILPANIAMRHIHRPTSILIRYMYMKCGKKYFRYSIPTTVFVRAAAGTV